MKVKEHAYINTLKSQFVEGKIDRREFLRTATLLGLSSTAAYAFTGALPQARAGDMPIGGALRIGMRVPDLRNPHTYERGPDSINARQVVEYLTKTGQDNITRPYLLEGWDASEDLKTWTLNLRKGIKWHNGRDFTADDVVWNINHVLDAETGSSVLGLMKAYMLEEFDTGEKDDKGNAKMSTKLWDANAIEKVDDFTVRLNAKVPQLAVPEHLFHYPFGIIDPEENGFFDVGSNGTGAFDLVELETTKRALYKPRKDYWGEGPYVDSLEFIDLGDDPSAGIGAMASKQVHGLYESSTVQLDALSKMPHLEIYEVPTASTMIVRGFMNEKPWSELKVRQAIRYALDSEKIVQAATRGHGVPGEHHHVCPIHPEYAKLPAFKRDVERAKRLLAEAGYPDGLDLEITCRADPPVYPLAVQAMVEQWKDAGIRVKIKLLPVHQYWEIWDQTPFGSTDWLHRPLGIMVLGLAYRSGVPWNESRFSNPGFDRLLAQAEGTLDVDERREIMVKIEELMQEEGPIAQSLWLSLFTFFDKRVKGFKMHPTGYIFGNELALES